MSKEPGGNMPNAINNPGSARAGDAAPVPPRRGIMRVVGFFDTTTKVLVAVTGLLLGAAGLWAALHQVFKPADPVGPGSSVDAGSSADAQVRADRVQACERTHGMSRGTEMVADARGLPALVKICAWPRASYADQDGYTEISVKTEAGPGASEATGATLVDRIEGPCAQFLLTYDFGKQGVFDHQEPFTVTPGNLVLGTGSPYEGSVSDLSFYPNRDEVDVVHNSSYVLFTAACRS